MRLPALLGLLVLSCATASAQLPLPEQARAVADITLGQPLALSPVAGTTPAVLHVAAHIQCQAGSAAPGGLYFFANRNGHGESGEHGMRNVWQLEPREFRLDWVPQAGGRYVIDEQVQVVVRSDGAPRMAAVDTNVTWVATGWSSGSQCSPMGWEANAVSNPMRITMPLETQAEEARDSPSALAVLGLVATLALVRRRK